MTRRPRCRRWPSRSAASTSAIPKAHAYSGDLSRPASPCSTRTTCSTPSSAPSTAGRSCPRRSTILIGEREAMGYGALQERLGTLIHGTEDWTTLSVPKPMAAAGAWLETENRAGRAGRSRPGREALHQAVHGAHGGRPLRARHLARPQELLGWEPRATACARAARDGAPLSSRIRRAGTTANGLTQAALGCRRQRTGTIPRTCGCATSGSPREPHARNVWAQFLNIGLGAWLITAPAPARLCRQTGMTISDVVSRPSGDGAELPCAVLAPGAGAVGRGGGRRPGS